MSASTAASTAASTTASTASAAALEVYVCTVIAFFKTEYYYLTPFATAAADALVGCVCNRFCQN